MNGVNKGRKKGNDSETCYSEAEGASGSLLLNICCLAPSQFSWSTGFSCDFWGINAWFSCLWLLHVIICRYIRVTSLGNVHSSTVVTFTEVTLTTSLLFDSTRGYCQKLWLKMRMIRRRRRKNLVLLQHHHLQQERHQVILEDKWCSLPLLASVVYWSHLAPFSWLIEETSGYFPLEIQFIWQRFLRRLNSQQDIGSLVWSGCTSVYILWSWKESTARLSILYPGMNFLSKLQSRSLPIQLNSSS